MSIPLVQNNEKDSINTSIIAIKRNIERINMLLGLSNSEEIDTSEFVKKSDIVDEVEAGNMNPVTSNAVVPVDEVTSGNMHSVTSNAVAKVIAHNIKEWTSAKSGTTVSFIIPEEVFANISYSNGGVVELLCYASYTGGWVKAILVSNYNNTVAIRAIQSQSTTASFDTSTRTLTINTNNSTASKVCVSLRYPTA